MGDRKRVGISRSTVFNYWKDKAITKTGEVVPVSDCHGDAGPVVEDWGEPVCWACGAGFSSVGYMPMYDRLIQKGDMKSVQKVWDLSGVRLEKCHIVPFAKGGADDASNLFLLCPLCHKESPDTMDEAGFLRWVYNQRMRGPRISDFFGREMVEKLVADLRQTGKDPRTIRWKDVSQNVFLHNGRIAEASVVASITASCEFLPAGMDFSEALAEFADTFQPGDILGEIDPEGFEQHCKRMEESMKLIGRLEK